MPSKYASISWDVDDVLERTGLRGISLSDEQALDLICKEEKYILDAMRDAATDETASEGGEQNDETE